MVLTNAERARLVIKFLSRETGRTHADIAAALGYTNPTVLSQILNGRKKMPETLPARIAALDPRINLDFILGNSDEMLLSPQDGPETPQISTKTHSGGKSYTPQVNVPENGIFVPSELVQMISDLSATIKDQQRIITTLVETWAKRQ